VAGKPLDGHHGDATAGTDVIEAYKTVDRRESGWVKVELKPESKERKAA
jgi:hypothetical protein